MFPTFPHRSALPPVMHSHVPLADAIASIRFFEGFSRVQLERVLGFARVLPLKSGVTVVRQGEVISGLYGIVAGRVEISSSSEEGHRFIRRFGEPGETWGFLSVFDGEGSPYFYVADGDVQLLFIEKTALFELLGEFPDLWLRVVRELTRVHRETLQDIEELIFAALPVRLARLLVSIREREARDSATPARVKATQEQLAALLGVTRQSVSKELRCLEADGIIRISYRGITISDLVALERKTRPLRG